MQIQKINHYQQNFSNLRVKNLQNADKSEYSSKIIKTLKDGDDIIYIINTPTGSKEENEAYNHFKAKGYSVRKV